MEALNTKKEIPCFLCGELLEIKYSKKGKPYFICDPCGLQAFIRREIGINKLREIKTGKTANKNSLEIIKLTGDLEKLHEELKTVRENTSFFNSDEKNKSLEIAEKALEREIARLEEKLKGKNS